MTSDCERACQDMEEFLRNELCTEDAADIREHIQQCPSCAEELRVNQVLTEALKRACKEQAPEDFREQLLDRIRNFTHDAH